MADIPNVDALRSAHLKLKDVITSEWDDCFDENGTFVFVFGNPTQTPCTKWNTLICRFE
jgi:hypothetical protein